MSILDLFESSKHRNNVAHFAAMVNLAIVDGTLNDKELELVKKFAFKLDITDEEYDFIIEKPNKFPLLSSNSNEERLELIYDFFKIIYADHDLSESELKLVLNYAIRLGFSNEIAIDIINKSVKIFGGKIDFENYILFIKNM